MAKRLAQLETIGSRALKAARSGLATVEAAQAHGIGVGSLSNARALLKRGAPELVDLVEAGALRIEPAAAIARAHGQKRQKVIAAKGSGAVRQEARRLRNDTQPTVTAARPNTTGPIECAGHADARTEVDPAAYFLVDGLPFCSLACLLRAVKLLLVTGAPVIQIVNTEGNEAGLLRALDVDLRKS